MMQEFCEHVVGWTGIIMTEEQAAALLERHPKVAAEIDKWTVDDTATTDLILDAISTELVGREWPIYGEKADIGKFFFDLHTSAKEKGYGVKDE